jgi:uncharacterized protein YndB with AHSA1/START domain
MRLLAGLALIWACPLGAEVRSVTPSGFEVGGTVSSTAAPERVYDALSKIGGWWNRDHTYSGDAGNLSLKPEAGGCFCETIPADGAQIEHGRVVYAQPGKALRLHGALGPLQMEGVSAALTFTLKKRSDGGTDIGMSYVVGGYIRGGPSALAPVVDSVLNEQLVRLQAFANAAAAAR